VASATKTTAGITLPCPKCGTVAGDDVTGLTLRLHDMELSCSECSEVITRADLVALAAECDRLLRWLDLAATA
jgi:hypothetical protein